VSRNVKRCRLVNSYELSNVTVKETKKMQLSAVLLVAFRTRDFANKNIIIRH